MEITAQQLCEFVQGTLEGNPAVIIRQPAKLEEAGEGSISFLANPRYEDLVYTTGASALLVSRDFVPRQPLLVEAIIRVDNVYETLSKLLEAFGARDPQSGNPEGFKHPQSIIHDTATVDVSTSVGAFSIIERGVVVGAGGRIEGQVFIGENVRIGKNVVLHPGVKIYHECVIGDDCILHANTVVGSDGFGFAPQADGGYRKIPQIGNVVIGNDVEMGAGCTIDRATMGATIVGNGVKLDNMVHLAHNVEVGEHTVMAAQVGVSGSVKIGRNCMIGGQTGIVGHITIADGTRIQGRSGIARTVKTPNTALSGTPAFDYGKEQRAQAIFRQLPDLWQKILGIERALKAAGLL